MYAGTLRRISLQKLEGQLSGKKVSQETTSQRKTIIDDVSKAVAAVCQIIEGSREAAAEASLSLGYDIKFDSVGEFLTFKVWAKECSES